MRGSAGRTSTAGWLVLALILVSVIALEVTGSVSADHELTPSPSAGSSFEFPALEEAQPLPRAAIEDISARPLFAMSRRPPVHDADATSVKPAPSALAEILKLIGVIHAEGSGVALLRHPEHGVLRLRQDQDVDGWRLAKIDGDRIRLEQDQDVEWLMLRDPPFALETSGPQLAGSSTDPADKVQEIVQRAVD